VVAEEIRVADVALIAAAAAPAADSSLCAAVIPSPQACASGVGVADLTGWPVGLRTNAAASLVFAATELANATHAPVVDSGALPSQHAVALGIPADDPVLAARADALSLKPPDNDEGYALDVSDGGVVLVARAPAGVFYGVQTLLQLLLANGSAPACRIVDWPSLPTRGAYMFGASSEIRTRNLLIPTPSPLTRRLTLRISLQVGRIGRRATRP
jgi:hexosaminidase